MRNIWFILSLLLVNGLFAKEDFAFSEEKVIQNSFAANASFELEISNKHGDVVFETWDKDSVKIVVSIHVQSDKLERVADLIDIIDVRFSNLTQFISATTEWGSTSSGFKMNVMKLLSSQSISVDYKVMLPDGMEVSVENKFGDVVFENFSGELKVDLIHGKLFGNKLGELKLLKLNYGHATIKELDEADVVSKFSEISIGEINELNLDITSGEIEIEKVQDLNIVATGAQIEVENAGDVKLKGSFSEFEIENLGGTLDGELKFGALEVDKIATSFMGVDVKGSSTDIDLSFDQQIAFHYFVQMEKGKSFRIPSEGNTLDKQNEFGEIKDYEGLFATIPVAGKPANVSIRVKNSYVRFDID